MSHYLWNLFANLKNAQKSKKSVILQRNTKVCYKILSILWDENLILGFKNYEKDFKYLLIYLKYSKGKPAISQLQSVSKPGHRVYLSVKEIWKLENNLGIYILSTAKGIMSSRLCKKLNIGGELLVYLN